MKIIERNENFKINYDIFDEQKINFEILNRFPNICTIYKNMTNDFKIFQYKQKLFFINKNKKKLKWNYNFKNENISSLNIYNSEKKYNYDYDFNITLVSNIYKPWNYFYEDDFQIGTVRIIDLDSGFQEIITNEEIENSYYYFNCKLPEFLQIITLSNNSYFKYNKILYVFSEKNRLYNYVTSKQPKIEYTIDDFSFKNGKIFVGYYNNMMLYSLKLEDIITLISNSKDCDRIRCGLNMWEDYWWGEFDYDWMVEHLNLISNDKFNM